MNEKSDFEKAVTFVLNEEGGCANNADDPGGMTCYGISSRKYPHLYADGKRPTRSDAIKIYYIDYWQKFGCNNLSWPDNIVRFDTAVNMRPEVVEELASSTSNWAEFLLARCGRYLAIVKKAPVMSRWLPIWIGRVYRLFAYIKQEEKNV